MVKLGTFAGNGGLNDNESVLENTLYKIKKQRSSTMIGDTLMPMPINTEDINYNILKKMIHDDL
jgi:hypothetical protein